MAETSDKQGYPPRKTTESDGSGKDDLVKVVDRRGRKKEIPRSEYELKKRRRRKHERRSVVSPKNLVSVVFILVIMIAAAYIALKIVL